MLKSKIKSLPKNPGVYIFKDKQDNIIYIGKAKNLRNRVSSYFSSNHDNSPKTQFLVKNIFDLDYIIVDNETEALLLENKLIKKYKPKFNINLKDQKTYPYIKITNEKIPKILQTRTIKDDGIYFGPYTDGVLRREIVMIVVSLFKLITPKTYSSNSKLNYEIGLAPARNIKDIDMDEYHRNVEDAKEFLSGNTSKVLNKLKKNMKSASNVENFELALNFKNKIAAIEILKEKQKVDLLKSYDQDIIVIVSKDDKNIIEIFNITRGVISSKKTFRFNEFFDDLFEEFIKIFYSQNSIPREIIVNYKFWNNNVDKNVFEEYFKKFKKSKTTLIFPQKGDKLSLVKLAEKNANENFGKSNVLIQLKEKLKLKKIPNIIECFDMSNLSGDFLVGGMTRFLNEKEDKNGYRKFEIKSFKGKGDDFGAMREVLMRRYRKLKKEKLELPDLILIDGGRGHLNIAKEVLKELKLNIDLISIAKGKKRDKNEIYLINLDEPLIFDNNSSMMLFIRKIRDSVHNYVISYNRAKRNIALKKEFK